MKRTCFIGVFRRMLFTLLTILSTAVGMPTNETFTVGILAPITTVSQSFLAGAVLFDLDFRKNHDEGLVERFGQPIVEVPDLHPDLRVNAVIGVSSLDSGMDMRTVLDWVPQTGKQPAVDAVIGDYHSLVTARVAALLSAFHIPQIGWGATSAFLSNRQLYPNFARTIASDAAQGQAAWIWMKFFNIPSTTCLYSDASGEALYHVMADEAAAVEEAWAIHGIDAPCTESNNFNSTCVEQALQDVRSIGSRFLLLGVSAEMLAPTLNTMALEGMLHNGTYQTLAFSLFGLQRQAGELSSGLPLGLQQFRLVSSGSKFARFSEMWTSMTTEDIYGQEARLRYELDELQNPLENASASMLSDVDFTSTDNLHPMVPFIFDAGYTLVLAVNDLLNSGVAMRNLSGAAILNQIQMTSFEGISGPVSFDRLGERLNSYDLVNAQPSHSGDNVLVKIGAYSSATRAMVLDQPPWWANGEQNAAVPNGMLECLPRFEKDVATSRCLPCQPGIGCGYRPEDGFPIGVFGPFTSVSQYDMSVAVMVDLDIRKNFDPALVERFGPPIIDVPNLHKDFKMKIQLGTSDSKVATAMETTLNWFLGKGSSRVAGICGGYHSAITGPVGSNAAVFDTPQVIWGATSATLSDKVLYPWISRVISHDGLQSSAVWAWMNHFGVPAACAFYTREAYAQGLFQGISELAGAAGEASRVVGIGMAVQFGEDDFDMGIIEEAAGNAKNTGLKFVVLLSSDPGTATATLYGLELVGMLYSGAYHILGADTLGIAETTDLKPSSGLPAGIHKVLQRFKGALYPTYLEMWRKMVPDDVYGIDAQQRYDYDNFLVHPLEDGLPLLTAEDFASEPWGFSAFLFDSVYTYVFAINELLNANVAPEEIHGQRLLDAVHSTSFHGVTGMMVFDENYDRSGDYTLEEVRVTGGPLVEAAIWSASTGKFTFPFRDGETVLWMSGDESDLAPDALVACLPGQYWDESTGLCIRCTTNWYSFGGVREQAKCLPCDAGFTSTEPLGATECMPCSNGTYRALSDEACVECPAGTYGESAGQSACLVCLVGQYSSSPGQLTCDRCGSGFSSAELFTTMTLVEVNDKTEYAYAAGATSAEMCGCDRNTRQASSGECIACGDGANCKGMSDIAIEAGYFAEAMRNRHLSVFRCHGQESRCVGGVPGSTCAAGRKGITCAECEAGKTPAASGECVECGGSDALPFIAATLMGCLALLVVYWIIDSSERVGQSHALLLCAIALGQLVTVTQQLGVVGMLAVTWEEPVKSFMSFMGLLAFNVELLRLDCVSSQGPMEQFCMKVFVIFFALTYMLLIHVLVVSIRHRFQFRSRLKSLISAVGTMFMVFFISVTTTVLEPLQCQKHPNGKMTVRSYPSIICWETEEHTSMIVIGSIAFLAVPMAYLVGTCMVVRQFPKRMRAGDTAFLQAFAFLFVRNVALQIFSLQMVLLVGFACSLHLLPWRVKIANGLDCIFGAGTLAVVCLAAFFVESDTKDNSGLAVLTFCVVVTLLIFSPVAILFGAYRMLFRLRKPYQFFLCHHKNGSGAYTRLLKMSLKESPRVQQDVFIDSDHLDNLDKLFDYVANDTSTLTVVASEELFTRPWITNLEVLTENGMGRELLCETLLWVPAQPTIYVPDRVSQGIMDALVERLLNKELTAVPIDDSMAAAPSSASAAKGGVMVFDKLNVEAAAAVHILRKLLLPHMHHMSEKVPCILEQYDLPPSITVLLLICTNGLFENFDTHKVFVHAANLQGACTFLPVLCEQGFRFPPKDFAAHLRKLRPGFSGVETSAVSSVVNMIFKEIAINFWVQHAGQSLLALAAEDVARRLMAVKASSNSKSGYEFNLSRIISSPSGMSQERAFAPTWSGGGGGNNAFSGSNSDSKGTAKTREEKAEVVEFSMDKEVAAVDDASPRSHASSTSTCWSAPV